MYVITCDFWIILCPIFFNDFKSEDDMEYKRMKEKLNIHIFKIWLEIQKYLL